MHISILWVSHNLPESKKMLTIIYTPISHVDYCNMLYIVLPLKAILEASADSEHSGSEQLYCWVVFVYISIALRVSEITTLVPIVF